MIKEIDKINRNNISKFKIFGFINTIPTFRNSGRYNVEQKIDKEAKKISTQLRFDEDQAIIDKPLIQSWQDSSWSYSTAPYSYIATARKWGQTPEVITANLLVSTTIKGEKYILLQQRSINSGLYAGYYSIFGGSFSPKDDDDDIVTTALRELKEEIDGVLTSDTKLREKLSNANILLTQETDNGNLQFNFLGIEIELSDNAKGDIEEGAMVKIKESDIEQFVADNQEQITPLALSVLSIYKVMEEVV